ncbi:MAG: hypothetical protein ABI587_08085 [Gemmatimonadales bacterium]
MRILRPCLLASTGLLLFAASAAAQNPECAPYQGVGFTPQDYNICNAAIDGTQIFHPVAGLLVSGGNPVLGSVRPLGGLGHFSLTARVNATQLRTPDLNYDGNGTTVAQDTKIFAPAPLVEGALGLFKGMNGFLALDLLGSAQLLPTKAIDNLTVDPKARKIGSIALGLGYGARVGVFPGKAIIPSLTVSVMRRDIPRITYGDVTTGGDNYSYSLDLHATNLRAVAGYKLAVFNIGAGIGWDKYTGTANIGFVPNGGVLPAQTINGIKLDNTRTMAFLTAALDFPIFKIGAEAGYQLGKDQSLSTTFAGNNPKDKRLFAGAGIRLAF